MTVRLWPKNSVSTTIPLLLAMRMSNQTQMSSKMKDTGKSAEYMYMKGVQNDCLRTIVYFSITLVGVFVESSEYSAKCLLP
mmetsp:Transcript_17677/g.25526  ORF Transcript_17677/g.25526 Transcript_17677/m.25526 type:complete len:81 (-) Transcript_17677:25-267(-)